MHRDWNSHQRAGLVIGWLRDGEALTTREIALKCGVTYEAARKMMLNLEAILPIKPQDGRWRWIYNHELHEC